MYVIYKYQIKYNPDGYDLQLPINSKILKFDNQNEKATIWVLHDIQEEKRLFRFKIIMTGRDFAYPEYYDYIGTAQFEKGSFIAHLFLERK